MTESEIERARRVYDAQTRLTWWERTRRWWTALRRPRATEQQKRRQRLDRKAEVERKARSML